MCQPGCNKDTGSAVDKITPADCKASGQPCTDAGCGYSHTGERDHWLNEVGSFDQSIHSMLHKLLCLNRHTFERSNL